MKSLKFWMSLMMLALVATACSKKKNNSAPAAPVKTTEYYLQGNICYDKETNTRVDYSYCQNNNGGGYGENACVGYVYYTNYSQGYMDRVDCRNPRALYVECEDPEAYKLPGETVHCEELNYNGGGTGYGY